MKYIFCISILLVMSSCKEGNQSQGNTFKEFRPVGVGVDVDKIIAQRGQILTDACSLVPMADISEALGVEENRILIKDSTPPEEDPTHSSCFFKWEEPELANAGILLQVMRNPVGDDFPTYILNFIDSKRTNGEGGMGNTPVLFKTMQGLGDDGAYNAELGKYYWRLGDKVVLSIAFNALYSADEQYAIAREIGAIMTANYIKT